MNGNPLSLTEIEIIPVKPQAGLVAFASFVINNALYVSSVGIVTRPTGGFRITYPTKKISSTSLGILYPINKSVASFIENEILKKYEEVMKYDRYNSVTTA